MHTLLGLSSMLLVMLAGYLALGTLRRLADWSQRRDLQLLVLAAPIVALGLVGGGLHHFADRVCFLGAPPGAYGLGMALPLGMGLAALSGVGLGLVRLLLMHRLLTRPSVAAAPALQGLADRLAKRLGAPIPRV